MDASNAPTDQLPHIVANGAQPNPGAASGITLEQNDQKQLEDNLISSQNVVHMDQVQTEQIYQHAATHDNLIHSVYPQPQAITPNMNTPSDTTSYPQQTASSQPIPDQNQENSEQPAGVAPENEARQTESQDTSKHSSLQQPATQRAAVTKVKLADELNLFDWFRTKEIINQIAEKAKNSVESVVTVLDPGMKEYLYSGGNINIMVISDSDSLVSPIRDAFQTVFGRATVIAAHYNPPETASSYPIKLACGFDESIKIAQERIKNLRQDRSNVAQNQVVVVVQPSLVNVIDNNSSGNKVTAGLKLDENLLPDWFLTYSMVIEDPVLGATMHCFSQFIPLDSDIYSAAKEARFPEGLSNGNLGFAISIDTIMKSKLRLVMDDNSKTDDSEWMESWCGLNEAKLINELGISLAHLYKRKWNSCIS